MEQFDEAVMTIMNGLDALYSHISRLLITADGQMQTHHWIPWPRSPAVTGQQCRRELPRLDKEVGAHRFYRLLQQPPHGNLLPFIAVHLYDPATLLSRRHNRESRPAYSSFPGSSEDGSTQFAEAILPSRIFLPQARFLTSQPPQRHMKASDMAPRFIVLAAALAAVNNHQQLQQLVTTPLIKSDEPTRWFSKRSGRTDDSQSAAAHADLEPTMTYDYIAIRDSAVPQAIEPVFQHLVTTYASEVNKTVSMRRAVPDDRLALRPHGEGECRPTRPV